LALQNLALFDFDGTISDIDNFTPFMLKAIKPQRLLMGGVVLSPLIAAYKFGFLSATVMRQAIVRIGFRGRNVTEIQHLGLQYSREKLPKFIKPWAMQKILWHKAQNDVVVVVSASLDVYLAPWCNQFELDLICSVLESRDDVLTGRYVGGDCAGNEKLKRVQEKYNVGEFPVIYAYGDTEEDLPMMSIAHHKFYRGQEFEVVTWS
jgi:phosphatidylglycerophosphatase C